MKTIQKSLLVLLVLFLSFSSSCNLAPGAEGDIQLVVFPPKSTDGGTAGSPLDQKTIFLNKITNLRGHARAKSETHTLLDVDEKTGQFMDVLLNKDLKWKVDSVHNNTKVSKFIWNDTNNAYYMPVKPKSTENLVIDNHTDDVETGSGGFSQDAKMLVYPEKNNRYALRWHEKIWALGLQSFHSKYVGPSGKIFVDFMCKQEDNTVFYQNSKYYVRELITLGKENNAKEYYILLEEEDKKREGTEALVLLKAEVSAPITIKNISRSRGKSRVAYLKDFGLRVAPVAFLTGVGLATYYGLASGGTEPSTGGDGNNTATQNVTIPTTSPSMTAVFTTLVDLMNQTVSTMISSTTDNPVNVTTDDVLRNFTTTLTDLVSQQTLSGTTVLPTSANATDVSDAFTSALTNLMNQTFTVGTEPSTSINATDITDFTRKLTDLISQTFTGTTESPTSVADMTDFTTKVTDLMNQTFTSATEFPTNASQTVSSTFPSSFTDPTSSPFITGISTSPSTSSSSSGISTLTEAVSEIASSTTGGLSTSTSGSTSLFTDMMNQTVITSNGSIDASTTQALTTFTDAFTDVFTNFVNQTQTMPVDNVTDFTQLLTTLTQAFTDLTNPTTPTDNPALTDLINATSTFFTTLRTGTVPTATSDFLGEASSLSETNLVSQQTLSGTTVLPTSATDVSDAFTSALTNLMNQTFTVGTEPSTSINATDITNFTRKLTDLISQTFTGTTESPTSVTDMTDFTTKFTDLMNQTFTSVTEFPTNASQTVSSTFPSSFTDPTSSPFVTGISTSPSTSSSSSGISTLTEAVSEIASSTTGGLSTSTSGSTSLFTDMMNQTVTPPTSDDVTSIVTTTMANLVNRTSSQAFSTTFEDVNATIATTVNDLITNITTAITTSSPTFSPTSDILGEASELNTTTPIASFTVTSSPSPTVTTSFLTNWQFTNENSTARPFGPCVYPEALQTATRFCTEVLNGFFGNTSHPDLAGHINNCALNYCGDITNRALMCCNGDKDPTSSTCSPTPQFDAISLTALNNQTNPCTHSCGEYVEIDGSGNAMIKFIVGVSSWVFHFPACMLTTLAPTLTTVPVTT